MLIATDGAGVLVESAAARTLGAGGGRLVYSSIRMDEIAGRDLVRIKLL